MVSRGMKYYAVVHDISPGPVSFQALVYALNSETAMEKVLIEGCGFDRAA